MNPQAERWRDMAQLHPDETGRRQLPASLSIRDVPVGEALIALATLLEELAAAMPLVSDVECQLSIDPDGKAALFFRAYR